MYRAVPRLNLGGLFASVLLVIGCWPTAVHAQAHHSDPAAASSAGQPVIQSRAQLQRYLRDTASEDSPLDALPPGARKRFLGSINFTPNGIGGFSPDELEQELTSAQIGNVLDLFGLGAWTAQIQGLSAAEQAHRRSKSQIAARRRGCRDATSCPPSAIEKAYTALVSYQPPTDSSDAHRRQLITKRYDQLFGRWQQAANLSKFSEPDLRFLARAVQMALFMAPRHAYIGSLRRDLQQMHRRGMQTARGYTALHHALIASRQFAKAQVLATQHPELNLPVLPTWQAPARLPTGQPTALSIVADGRDMTREAFDMNAPLRIVVVASCHFSRDAARAVEADPELKRLFVDHAIWLANPSESITAAETWNQQFPAQPIHVAWSHAEWSMLESWAMPTFYVFRHGKLIDQWAGWPDDRSALQTMRKHLHQDGALTGG